MALYRLRAGSEGFVRARVFDMTQEPPVLFNPASYVKITVTNKAGVAVVNAQDMTHVGTGLYTYRYQTAPSDVTGPLRISITTADTVSHICVTEDMEGWLLVP